MARRAALATLVALLVGGAHVSVSAQQASVQLRASRHDTLVVDSSGVVTTAFVIENHGSSATEIAPKLAVPAGWRTLMGSQSFTIGRDSSELWLVSVSAPVTTQAGVYLLHASAGPTTDSADVAVRVDARRALSVVAVDIPGWVTAGALYTARFTVRNRGNVPASVSLSAVTGRGSRCFLDASTLSLAPGASANVTVRVPTTSEGHRSIDDVVELTVADRLDPQSQAVASIRTSVIPQLGHWDDDFTTMPAELTLRAAGAAAGVSPATLRGSGELGSHTSLDFSVSAPTRAQSPFGELPISYGDLKGSSYDIRAGDALYGFSPLTSAGLIGKGVSVDKTEGAFTVGAYTQSPMWNGYGPSQLGAMIGTRAGAPAQVSALAVEQVNPSGEHDRVYGAQTTLRLGDAAVITGEEAASDSANGATATQFRVGGTVNGLTYNAGFLHSGMAFAGPSRGLDHRDLSFSTQQWDGLRLIGSGSTQSLLATTTVSTSRQTFSEIRTGVEIHGLTTVEYDQLDQDDGSGAPTSVGQQRGVRLNANVPAGRFGFSLTTEGGSASGLTSPASHAFFDIGGSARISFATATFSVFGQRNDGNTLGGAGRASTTGGVTAQAQLTPSLQLVTTATAAGVTVPLGLPDSRGWFGQADARLEYKLANGTVLSLRVHEWEHPELQGALTPSIVYLEMRQPLRLPTGFRREPGRVQGRVVDAETGKPLSGTLVRLGDQAAITDRNGRVSFSGLEPASYRVAVDAMGKSSGAILVGDANVSVPKDVGDPASFSVGVVHGAHLQVSVRQQSYVATVGRNADSLVDSGEGRGLLVGLAGARDTIYQTADDRGRVDFGDVIPGAWTLFIASGGDAGSRSTPQTFNLQPGDNRSVTLPVLPERKAVTVIAEATELVATPAHTAASATVHVGQLAKDSVILAPNLTKVAIDSGEVALAARRLKAKKRGSERPRVDSSSHRLKGVGGVVNQAGVPGTNRVLKGLETPRSVVLEHPQNWFIRILYACGRKIRAELVKINTAIVSRFFRKRGLVNGHPALDHGK